MHFWSYLVAGAAVRRRPYEVGLAHVGETARDRGRVGRDGGHFLKREAFVIAG